MLVVGSNDGFLWLHSRESRPPAWVSGRERLDRPFPHFWGGEDGRGFFFPGLPSFVLSLPKDGVPTRRGSLISGTAPTKPRGW